MWLTTTCQEFAIRYPIVRELLDAFRRSQREVIYTRHGALLADGRDMILRRQQRDESARELTDRPTLWSKGSHEHQVVSELSPMDRELVIDKNASSPFNGTGIDQLLRNMNLQTLIVVGMATDMCVETTARDAADRGYNVIVVEDATATFFEDHHRAALSSLARRLHPSLDDPPSTRRAKRMIAQHRRLLANTFSRLLQPSLHFLLTPL